MSVVIRDARRIGWRSWTIRDRHLVDHLVKRQRRGSRIVTPATTSTVAFHSICLPCSESDHADGNANALVGGHHLHKNGAAIGAGDGCLVN
jgi:hypothetical protein